MRWAGIRHSAIRQRPILLMGPQGGKTQVMEVARGARWHWWPTCITHHTRQSAVGLPFIRQRHYGDKDVSVTEYTMSEIIASIYAKMEATGLFGGHSVHRRDQLHVSRRLPPPCQFLQCKTFGIRLCLRAGHRGGRQPASTTNPSGILTS